MVIFSRTYQSILFVPLRLEFSPTSNLRAYKGPAQNAQKHVLRENVDVYSRKCIGVHGLLI